MCVIKIVSGFVMDVSSKLILNQILLHLCCARGVMIRLFCPSNGWCVD